MISMKKVDTDFNAIDDVHKRIIRLNDLAD